MLVTQRIGVVPARATTVNGIRPDDFISGTLALTALFCDVVCLTKSESTMDGRPLNYLAFLVELNIFFSFTHKC